VFPADDIPGAAGPAPAGRPHNAAVITISGAERILIDAQTQTTGDLLISDVVLAPGTAGSGSGAAAARADGSEVIDASGCVVTPGLVNAHHHLLQSAFRTLPGTRGVPMREWLGVMARAYTSAGVDPELCARAAAVAVAEGLLCGVTTVADHHLTWPAGADDVALARATAQTAAALGSRLVFVRGSAGGDPERAALSAEAIVRALLPDPGPGGGSTGEGGAEGVRTGGVSADGLLQLAVGPAGVHSDPRETFTLLAEVAQTYGLRRRTQANEQVDVEAAAEKYGRRPLELLADWGWLAPDVTLAHLCAVTPAEIAALVAAGISATHAPGCDLPMGWGVAPVAALRAAGIRVGLGTSGGGSNDAGHLLADARLAMQVAPLAPLIPPGAPALSALDVLGMATEGSAAGLGRSELGHLRPGAAADLCVWDVSGVADAGVADPVGGLLWAAPGRRPKHVIVAGRVVVRDGVLITADERHLAESLWTRIQKLP
jgi:cytosine/adenosine deaminase-related metal-dependent hydrolase